MLELEELRHLQICKLVSCVLLEHRKIETLVLDLSPQTLDALGSAKLPALKRLTLTGLSQDHHLFERMAAVIAKLDVADVTLVFDGARGRGAALTAEGARDLAPIADRIVALHLNDPVPVALDFPRLRTLHLLALGSFPEPIDSWKNVRELHFDGRHGFDANLMPALVKSGFGPQLEALTIRPVSTEEKIFDALGSGAFTSLQRLTVSTLMTRELKQLRRLTRKSLPELRHLIIDGQGVAGLGWLGEIPAASGLETLTVLHDSSGDEIQAGPFLKYAAANPSTRISVRAGVGQENALHYVQVIPHRERVPLYRAVGDGAALAWGADSSLVPLAGRWPADRRVPAFGDRSDYKDRLALWTYGIHASRFAAVALTAERSTPPAQINQIKPLLDWLQIDLDYPGFVASRRAEREERIEAWRQAIEDAVVAREGEHLRLCFSFGWWASRAFITVRNKQGEPAIACEAGRFFDEWMRTKEPNRSELAEVVGWCDVYRRTEDRWRHLDRGEYVVRVGGCPFNVPVDPNLPQPTRQTSRDWTLEDIPLEELLRRVIQARISALMSGCIEEQIFEGSVTDGSLIQNPDGFGYSFAWNEHGIVGFGLDIYCADEEQVEAGPMKLLRPLPKALAPLPKRLTKGLHCFACGLWITREARHHFPPGRTSEHGFEYVRAITDRRGGPGGEREQVARSLAERAIAGGGVVSDEEWGFFLERDAEEELPAEPQIPAMLAALEALGLTRPGAEKSAPAKKAAKGGPAVRARKRQ